MTEARSLLEACRSRPAQYEVEFIEDIRIPSSVDGLSLGADLFLPVTDRPVPTLVTLHSARKDGIGGIGARKYLRYFAERGYATLYVDCFGIGTSEGEPRPMLSPGEVDDGVAVVEWAAQQSWCTGSVGMWGLSHGGMTTLAVAARRPRHLRAIFPVMGWTDMEQDLVYPDGLRSGIAMFGHLSLFNIFCALLPALRRGDRAKYESLWKERLEKFEPWFVDAWRHRAGHGVWSERRFDPADISVPALCVTGWRDLFCGSMIRAYQRIQTPKKLLVGPWLHSFPDASSVEAFPSVALACEWWDRWLYHDANGSSGAEAAIVYIQGADSRWAETRIWPPADTRQHVYEATTSGQLHFSPARSEAGSKRPDPVDLGVVTHISDLTVGALSGLTKHPIDRFGHPLDQHDDDVRSLTFTSLPVKTQLIVAGTPTVRLVLDPTTSASQCVIKLADIDENGRSTLIVRGAVALSMVADGSCIDRSVVLVSLDPTCYRVAAGHRLRLILSESDFPSLWPPTTAGRLTVRARDATGTDMKRQLAATTAANVTTLQLPICHQDELVEFKSRPASENGAIRTRGEPSNGSWEIARDHVDGSVLFRVEKTDRAPYMHGSEKFLSMRTNIQCETGSDASSNTIVTACGENSVEMSNGDNVVVKGNITMRTTRATVAAEILANDRVMFSREWELAEGNLGGSNVAPTSADEGQMQ